jgi:hypothetical protein
LLFYCGRFGRIKMIMCGMTSERHRTILGGIEQYWVAFVRQLAAMA